MNIIVDSRIRYRIRNSLKLFLLSAQNCYGLWSSLDENEIIWIRKRN